ncbi:hypothetical protein [Lacticaseibacillus porcinae]|uniref:hypothetical protein n=1 Tax=Lacticaseibacillus porcinae TaxID=1123687 RepID=UPI000F7A75AE|nr:hypothetical protein [Lacticaseibacillus porcinae]
MFDHKLDDWQHATVMALPAPTEIQFLDHRAIQLYALTIGDKRLPDHTGLGKLTQVAMNGITAHLDDGVLTLHQAHTKDLVLHPTALVVGIAPYDYNSSKVGLGVHPGLIYNTLMIVTTNTLTCSLWLSGGLSGQYILTHAGDIPVSDPLGITKIDAKDNYDFNDQVNAIGFAKLAVGTEWEKLDLPKP